MISINTTHQSGTYINSINVELELVGDNIDNYGIAFSNVQNVQKFSNENNCKIMVNRTCDLKYYIFKKPNVYIKINNENILNFIISYNKEITPAIVDMTSGITPDLYDKDSIKIDLTAISGSKLYGYSQFLEIDNENINRKITPDMVNTRDCMSVGYDYNTVTNIKSKIFIPDYHIFRKVVTLFHLSESDEESYSTKNYLMSTDILQPYLKCVDMNNSIFNSSYVYNGYILRLLSNFTSGDTTTQENAIKNNLFEIEINNQHNYSYTETHLKTYVQENILQHQYITFFGNSKIKVKTINPTLDDSNQNNYLLTDSLFNDAIPERPLINSVITDNKIHILVNSTAKKLVYKLHYDTTSFDTTTEQITIDLNRIALDFYNITQKNITIDCTSNVASIEAFVIIGLLSKEESVAILNNNLLPQLSKSYKNIIDVYSPKQETPTMFPVTSNDYYKTLFLFGSSDLSKQIVTNDNNIKLNNYNVIIDSYSKKIEIKSEDTTTFNIDITFLNNINNYNYILSLIINQYYKNSTTYQDSNINNYAFLDSTGIKSNNEIISNLNLIDTEIIKNGKMLLTDGLYVYGQGNNTFLFPHPTISSEFNTSTQENEYTINKAINQTPEIYKFFTTYNISITSIDFYFDIYISSEKKYMNVNQTVDKNLILDKLEISDIKIYLDNSLSENDYYSFNFPYPKLSNDAHSISNSGIGETGIRTISFNIKLTDIFDNINFTDPEIINKFSYNPIIHIIPKIYISGGNLTNGTIGYGDKTNYNIDYIISDNTIFNDDTAIMNIIVDNTSSAIIDIPTIPILKTNNHIIMRSLLANNNLSILKKELESNIQLNINNEYSTVCKNFVTGFPLDATILYDPFYDCTSSTIHNHAYNLNIAHSNIKFSDNYDVVFDYDNSHINPSYNSTITYLPNRILGINNYYNPVNNAIEFDIIMDIYANKTIKPSAFEKIKLNEPNNLYKPSLYNREIAENKLEYILKYSKVLTDDSKPIPPVIQHYSYLNSYYRYYCIAIRSHKIGKLSTTRVSKNVYTFPEQQNRQEMEIYKSPTDTSYLTKMTSVYNAYSGTIMYQQSYQVAPNVFIKIKCIDKLNIYPVVYYQYYINSGDQKRYDGTWF